MVVVVVVGGAAMSFIWLSVKSVYKKKIGNVLLSFKRRRNSLVMKN